MQEKMRSPALHSEIKQAEKYHDFVQLAQETQHGLLGFQDSESSEANLSYFA